MAKTTATQTYSIAQAAKVLGVPPRTIYGQVARGELPAIRLSGRLLILRAVIDGILLLGLPKAPAVSVEAEDEQW
jgi:excisionase family DNA binding protein